MRRLSDHGHAETTETADRAVAVGALDIVDHDQFQRGYPHERWARLRGEAPVCPMRIPGWEPFWAVTTPEPIRRASSQPTVFLNGPSLHVRSTGDEPDTGFRSVLNMDPPDHAVYRRLVTDQLTRRWVAAQRPLIERATHRQLDALAERADGSGVVECDFVADVTEQIPFTIISTILGIPPEDHAEVLRLMNLTLVGGLPGFWAYMRDLALDRRVHPRADADAGVDLGSVLSAAQLDGRLIGETELVSYYCSLATAAHGTVRNAMSGGVLALVQNPRELERLRADRTLIGTAVEEVLRWTTPIIGFARTAAHDTSLEGQEIAAGDRLLLLYASANRDADTFSQPSSFAIDRQPNPHLAFGIGEHYCMGARLARLELCVLLDALLDRIADVELVGEPTYYGSSLLSGPARLPLRFRFADRG